VPTLSLICDIADPLTKDPYSRDPRYVAKKAEAVVKKLGYADAAYFGPEAEFFIFDDVRYSTAPDYTFFAVDAEESHWNTARDEGPNLSNKIRPKEATFQSRPGQLNDVRGDMVLTMIDSFGINIETHHHEVRQPDRRDDMRFDTLVKMADNLMTYKYVVKNVAKRHGKVAPSCRSRSMRQRLGMHVHQSLWKEGKPLFADQAGYAGLSQIALQYIGGLLTHAPAILAFAAPPRTRMQVGAWL